ncbi:hypothetical protein [Granulicoccus sp. GXG6511]|uniref:hypothetical protein n=1 Tax=Granulicoccus sp. GXG6511 TaxID=3381351 RepID=UPI003D7D4A0B
MVRAVTPARIAAGALAGFAWAGAFRDWMVHLAGDASVTTWQTPVFVLAPGAAIGGLLGYASGLRRAGRPVPRALVAAPLIFGVALFYPPNLLRVFRTGEGTGALGIALVAMAGAYALAGRGRPAARVATGVLAVAGVVGTAFTPAGVNPDLGLGSPEGLWVALQGSALVALFAIAATAPYGRRTASGAQL